jgi:hypothetical protein
MQIETVIIRFSLTWSDFIPDLQMVFIIGPTILDECLFLFVVLLAVLQ